MRQSVRDKLLDAARLIRRAELAPEASAAALSERVTGSKPGSSHLTFDADLPLAEAMERSLERWVEVWAAQVDQGRTIAKGDRTSSAAKARQRAILGERGLPAVAVAFTYGMTEHGVMQIRGRHGLDPDTGLRQDELRQQRIDGKPSKRAPLTAPPRAAMDDLEARDQEEVTDE